MRSLWIFPILLGCGDAGRHSHSLHISEVSSANHKCGSDAVRNGQLTADGEPIRFWVPCWDRDVDARYRVHARFTSDARLASVERTQCIGLAPTALEYSPFAQREAIEEIVPRRSGSSIVGAHIVFEEVPGLTVSWMRRAIACHRARWQVLGKPADYLSADPTILDGIDITVSEANHRVVVRVESDSDAAARMTFARAEALVSERVATH
jgi:hypothetical protein